MSVQHRMAADVVVVVNMVTMSDHHRSGWCTIEMEHSDDGIRPFGKETPCVYDVATCDVTRPVAQKLHWPG